MVFAYSLSKLIKINDKKFIKAMNSFLGLPHRYEVFLKKKNVNDFILKIHILNL